MRMLPIAVALLFSGNVHAVNKCIGADGKQVYQDAPCAGKGGPIDIRPASGWPSRARVEKNDSGAPTAGGAPLTAAERMEQQVDASKRERRRRELETVVLPNSAMAISRHHESCNRNIEGLRARKGLANNNLAGAQWETSISGEMAAVAARCDTRSRDLRAELDSHRSECLALGGCK